MKIARLAGIVLIILLAAGVRVYRIHRYPVRIGPFEGIAGYQAILIAEGDREAARMAWTRAQQPLYGSTGIGWNPFLIYPMAVVYRLIGFDLSHIGIRVVPIIYGVLSVWLIYLLMSGLFGTATGLSSAFLLAVASWFITISRTSSDFSATVFYSILCLLIYSRAGKNVLMYLLLGALLALGTYFYLPARVISLVVFLSVVLRCIFERGYLKARWMGLILMAGSFYALCLVQGLDPVSYYEDLSRKRAHERAWVKPEFPDNVIQHSSIAYRHFFVNWGWGGTSELSYERDDVAVDPISRWLIAGGLLLSLIRIKNHRYRLLLIWLIFSVTPLVLTSTRMKRGLLLIPVFSSLAAVGLCGTVEMIVGLLDPLKNRPGVLRKLWFTGRIIGVGVICYALFLAGKANLDNYFGEYARMESRLLERRDRWALCLEQVSVLEEKDLYTDCWLGEPYRTGEYLSRCVGKGNRLFQLPPVEARREFRRSERPAVLYLKSGEREEK